MNRNQINAVAPAVLLGAVSGARSMTGLAAVARVRAINADANDDSQPGGPIGPRVVRRLGRTVDHKMATGATVLAILELMTDKTPGMARRIDAGPLVTRVAAGAIAGGAIAQMRGQDRSVLAAGGALAAFAGAHVSYRFRQSLEDAMPAFVAGIVEDAVVLGIAAVAARLLLPRSRPAATWSLAPLGTTSEVMPIRTSTTRRERSR